MKATMLELAAETAQVLGISEKDALVLEFLAAKAWAMVKGDVKTETIMHLGASHAAGIIDGDTMRKCLALVKPRAPKRSGSKFKEV